MLKYTFLKSLKKNKKCINKKTIEKKVEHNHSIWQNNEHFRSFQKHHKNYDRATVAKNGGKTNRKFSIVNRSRRRIIASSFQEGFVFHATS